MTPFLLSVHQASNSCLERPLCIIPGLAMMTHGPTSSNWSMFWSQRSMWHHVTVMWLLTAQPLHCAHHVTIVWLSWLSCDHVTIVTVTIVWPSCDHCDSCAHHVTTVMSCDYHVTIVSVMWLSCDHCVTVMCPSCDHCVTVMWLSCDIPWDLKCVWRQKGLRWQFACEFSHSWLQCTSDKRPCTSWRGKKHSR